MGKLVLDLSPRRSLRSLARLLLIIGGVLLILGAVLQLAGDFRSLLDLAPRVPSLSGLGSVIVGVVVGLIALVGAGQVSSPVWGVVLLILGFLFIGSLGGILIFIGAIIALVADFI